MHHRAQRGRQVNAHEGDRRGVLAPRKGRVIFEGRDIGGRRPDLVFREGIVTVPQGRNTFPDMTVWENMLMGAYSIRDRQLVKQRIDRVIRLLPVVAEKRNTRAGLLSGGQKRVEIGRAMLVEPKLLILDEPTMGLGPQIARVVLERVERLHPGRDDHPPGRAERPARPRRR